jgi:SAM-dependent methyltransferase
VNAGRNVLRCPRRSPMATVMSHAEIFNSIYRRNAWAGAGSGAGSLPQNAKSYMAYLQRFMRSNRIRSVVDLGCGDWRFSRHIDWSGIDYTGIDVSSVVLETTRNFARPGISFMEMDGLTGDLPAADLLLAKDVLQHWSNAEISHFVARLPQFRMALITNGFPPNARSRVNEDIRAGDWRPVDLSQPPFNVHGTFVYWYQADEPKFLFLWRNDDRAPAASGTL